MIFIFEQAQKSRWPGYQQSKKNTEHLQKIEYKRSEKLRMFLNGFIATLKKNPADLLTRSENFENFRENKFWFQGPEFLKHKSTFENRDFQNSFDVEHVFFT